MSYELLELYHMSYYCVNGHHTQVAYVNYPGLPSHSGHEVAKRVMKDFSGMISFELKGGLEAGIKLVEVS